MMKLNLSILIIILLFIASCKKEDVIINPPMSDIPYIELISVSPTTITAFEDSIEFIVYYEDGNGDLGYFSPDSLSLFITDTRIPLTESFYIPILAPEGADIAIQGQLKVILNNTILVDADADSETVQFEVMIKDRSGNISNTVLTEVLTVIHQ